MGDKTHEDLFDFNDNQKLVLENDQMFIILPKESWEKNGLYTSQPELASYQGFQVAPRTAYSSQEQLNVKKVAKLI